MLKFRNLTITPNDPVTNWGVEGLATALERGGLTHLIRIVDAVREDPYGEFSEDVLQAVEIANSPIAGLVGEKTARIRAAYSRPLTTP